MTTRRASHRDPGCLFNLLTLAGTLLMITAGAILFPVIRDAILPPPADFGKVALPLRPTLTPLPGAGQPPGVVAPAVLPETPLLRPDQTLPTQSAVTPDNISPSAQIPTRIVIPQLHLDAPIETVGWSLVDGVSAWNIPNHFAAGWLKTSATLGLPGNTVLDGHHNIAGEVFRHLVDLQPGALIEVDSKDRAFTYTVTVMRILPDRDQPIEVRRQNAEWIQPTSDERLTLVTCWPYTSNTHRLIVVAVPVNPDLNHSIP